MQQTELFSQTPTPRLARRRDPSTSHTAGERLRASGKLRAQQRQVLDALTRWPGSTAVELATNSGLDRYLVSRRLPELARVMLVRRAKPRVCKVNGSAQTTWYAA
jgi:DNA-binding MarR family transcriptional regulator